MGLARTCSIVVEEGEAGGGYFPTVPALPGYFTPGKTVGERHVRAVEAIKAHIAGLEADDEAVPDKLEPPRLLAVTVAA
ncbi:MAG: type II toxin-antitoxin system HicB family antitoxin [Acidimicrobiales bacterium]